MTFRLEVPVDATSEDFRWKTLLRILLDVDFPDATEYASDDVYGGGAVEVEKRGEVDAVFALVLEEDIVVVLRGF